ncbi:hypothetical protein BOTCAL_0008g00010 [Botryotinia calthae]|uniref:Uncharacterized protein n=1 Tax=Botryotinia calthae TaxID=38488 RepID=A0A4Y8DGZ6_9HELO|nr:hypothetical protein BOTCAL_0008g00010 [Botryotinia calthae]
MYVQSMDEWASGCVGAWVHSMHCAGREGCEELRMREDSRKPILKLQPGGDYEKKLKWGICGAVRGSEESGHGEYV